MYTTLELLMGLLSHFIYQLPMNTSLLAPATTLKHGNGTVLFQNGSAILPARFPLMNTVFVVAKSLRA